MPIDGTVLVEMKDGMISVLCHRRLLLLRGEAEDISSWFAVFRDTVTTWRKLMAKKFSEIQTRSAHSSATKQGLLKAEAGPEAPQEPKVRRESLRKSRKEEVTMQQSTFAADRRRDEEGLAMLKEFIKSEESKPNATGRRQEENAYLSFEEVLAQVQGELQAQKPEGEYNSLPIFT